MKKKDKRAETAESTAVVEDSKLENVIGGDIPDGHSHQDSDREFQQPKPDEKPWFAIDSERGNKESKTKPFESDGGTTPTAIIN